jgi:flavin-dependent dehydrogenase
VGRSVDLIVIGAGPAGCAAAIWAAARGLSVHLVERLHSPRVRPGECLHPGIEVLFRDLAVLDEVLEQCTIRSAARTTVIHGRRSLASFGADADGAWRALHVARAELDAILLKRAKELGVRLHIHRSRVTPIVRNEMVEGVELDGQPFRSSFVIDASGQRGWLTRSMGLKHLAVSPRLTAFYGYCEGRLFEEQLFEAGAVGWQWLAQVSPGIVNWTSLCFGAHKRPQPPAALSSLPSCNNGGGADVTWRIAPSVAGPSYFIVGDAAFVTDPASGNGVLRAVMTGIKAAYNARAVLCGYASPVAAAQDYRAWIRRWFEADITHLASFYDKLRSDWRGADGTASVQRSEF